MSQQEYEICNKIYEENKDHLKWYMYKYFSWLNKEDIHDIMQDTWHKLSENISTIGYLTEAEQCNWLMAVCHNQTVSFLRKQKRFVDMDSESMETLLESKKMVSLEKEVIDKVMVEELLKHLTEEDIKLLLCKELSGTEERQRRSNADNCKVYRLRKKMKEMWKEGGWDE